VTFQEAQAYLDSLQMHKIKLGLEAMEAFLERVDRPEKKLRFVHVAGTNGKGSVSVNIAAILAQAGYRVGLFTSPHLSSVRERFRINDRYISEAEFTKLAEHVRTVLGDEKITYFEFTTALALLWFEESAVDLVVLETGLGGRLDATNVVTPLVSIITNVSMDHEAYLGTTLEEIAFEKAGIIKENIPLVTGAEADIGRRVIEQRCREKKTAMYLFGHDFLEEDDGGGVWRWRSVDPRLGEQIFSRLRCGMRGDYQRQNSSLAVAAVVLLQPWGFKVDEEDVRRGLAKVLWPGRLEYIRIDRGDRSLAVGEPSPSRRVVRYLIDGAHNPAGVASLRATLAREYDYKNLILVWGAMADKDLRQTLPVVAPLAAAIILAKPQGERAAEPEMLRQALSTDLWERCRLIVDVEGALRSAEELAGDDDLIVVAGSLYLIGEVRSRLVGHMVDQTDREDH